MMEIGSMKGGSDRRDRDAKAGSFSRKHRQTLS